MRNIFIDPIVKGKRMVICWLLSHLFDGSIFIFKFIYLSVVGMLLPFLGSNSVLGGI